MAPTNRGMFKKRTLDQKQALKPAVKLMWLVVTIPVLLALLATYLFLFLAE